MVMLNSVTGIGGEIRITNTDWTDSDSYRAPKNKEEHTTGWKDFEVLFGNHRFMWKIRESLIGGVHSAFDTALNFVIACSYDYHWPVVTSCLLEAAPDCIT